MVFFIAILASLAVFGMALIYFGTRPIPPGRAMIFDLLVGTAIYLLGVVAGAMAGLSPVGHDRHERPI